MVLEHIWLRIFFQIIIMVLDHKSRPKSQKSLQDCPNPNPKVCKQDLNSSLAAVLSCVLYSAIIVPIFHSLNQKFQRYTSSCTLPQYYQSYSACECVCIFFFYRGSVCQLFKQANHSTEIWRVHTIRMVRDSCQCTSVLQRKDQRVTDGKPPWNHKCHKGRCRKRRQWR